MENCEVSTAKGHVRVESDFFIVVLERGDGGWRDYILGFLGEGEVKRRGGG